MELRNTEELGKIKLAQIHEEAFDKADCLHEGTTSGVIPWWKVLVIRRLKSFGLGENNTREGKGSIAH